MSWEEVTIESGRWMNTVIFESGESMQKVASERAFKNNGEKDIDCQGVASEWLQSTCQL